MFLTCSTFVVFFLFQKTHDENIERIYCYLDAVLRESENEVSALFWLYGIFFMSGNPYSFYYSVLMIYYQMLIIIFKDYRSSYLCV